MALIKCENITLAYDNHTVVEDLSFDVNSGDYLCIIGENGSGKTTLMKAILGLKNVSNGTISFGDGLRKNEIGYLPQQTGIQKDFPASVFEVVISGCLNSVGFRPFYSHADKKRAMDNMLKLGISDIRDRCYRELSGGQQQRVLLARALCATKKLLLLDEPVTGLDPVAQAELYDIIDHLNKKHGITVIMITHDVTGALSRASHILHLHKDVNFFGTREHYAGCEVCRHYVGEDGIIRAEEGTVHHDCCDTGHTKHIPV